MPKAILEFQLPEEREEFEIANNGRDYYLALHEIDQHLRSCLKHGHDYKSVEELAEQIRRMNPGCLY
jgi:hypothetical protein